MKKFIMLLLIITSAAFSLSAQETTYYTAYKTEIKRKYKWQLDWETIARNSNQNISIMITGSTISIAADAATTFIVDQSTEQEMDGDKISARIYDAVEVVNQKECRIEFVFIKKTKEVVIGVTYFGDDKNLALHYFIYKN